MKNSSIFFNKLLAMKRVTSTLEKKRSPLTTKKNSGGVVEDLEILIISFNLKK